jgi:Flp pilus assembly protein TadB
MEVKVSQNLTDLEARWRLREREWRGKLGQLRLGVEPLEEQLARYRRVTWGLTVVTGIIAVMFLSLFSVFGRPDIGLILVAILLLPIMVFSWVGYKRMERRADAFRAELAQFEAEKSRLLGPRVETTTTSGPA